MQQADGFDFLDYIISSMFAIDIIITFNSAYYDNKHQLITSRRTITNQYLKTWFLLDIFVIFPFEIFTNPNGDSFQDTSNYTVARLPKIFRLLRIFRLIRMIKKAHLIRCFDKLEDHLSLGQRRILLFFLSVTIAIHYCGCFWYYIAKVNNFGPDTWVHQYNYQYHSDVSLYIASIYWTVTTLTTCGFGDIHAQNDYERIFSIVWMVFGAGIYSYTIGSLSNLIGNLKTKQSLLVNRISTSDDFCQQTELNNDLRDRIRSALTYSSIKSSFSKSDRDQFLEEIPIDLKFNIADSMYEGLKNKIPFFQNKEPSFIANFVTQLSPFQVQQGQLIYQRGEHPSLVYFIVSGRVNMVIGMHQITFKTYVQGSLFGEFEIFDSQPRLQTSRAQVDCDMLTITQTQFLDILQQFPEYYLEVKEVSLKRFKQETKAIKNLNLITNISYNSKFWEKKNRPNSSNQQNEQDQVESDNDQAGSLTPKSKQRRFSVSGIVPIKRSMIDNEDKTVRNKQNNLKVSFSQNFIIPSYIKDQDKNFINIKITQNQDEFNDLTQNQPQRRFSKGSSKVQSKQFLSVPQQSPLVKCDEIIHDDEQNILTKQIEQQQLKQTEANDPQKEQQQQGRFSVFLEKIQQENKEDEEDVEFLSNKGQKTELKKILEQIEINEKKIQLMDQKYNMMIQKLQYLVMRQTKKQQNNTKETKDATCQTTIVKNFKFELDIKRQTSIMKQKTTQDRIYNDLDYDIESLDSLIK